ncbi:hypothetical protein HZS_4080 [Henneguya salminicola]|nr:hypothetical protein HZS_4080 [Henneguya salminicola]
MSTEKISSSLKKLGPNNNYSSSTETRYIVYQEKTYTVSVKDNEGSRMIQISENSKTKKRTMIDIPMFAIKDFSDKLNEIDIFLKTYKPKNVSQRNTKTQPETYPLTKVLTTTAGRKYFMDVFDAYDCANLIISYVYRDRRYSLDVFKDVIPEILKHINELLEKYPPISQEEETIQPFRREKERRKSNMSDIQRTLIKTMEKMAFSDKNGNKKELLTLLNKLGSNDKRSSGLVALTDPPPLIVEGDIKTYKFEIVEGEKTFIRTTERINNSRKAALHIPLDMFEDFIDGAIVFNESILDENQTINIGFRKSSYTSFYA